MKSMKPQEPLIRVVDDEEEVRDSLKFMLECEGWLVSAYASGFDLLKDFDRSRPGCILLDVRMPDLSGPELQEKLNLMGSRVPIVFITSYSDIHAAIATLKAGADDFLLKPVDPENFWRLLRVRLNVPNFWRRARYCPKIWRPQQRRSRNALAVCSTS